jgi:hypothetical protein
MSLLCGLSDLLFTIERFGVSPVVSHHREIWRESSLCSGIWKKAKICSMMCLKVTEHKQYSEKLLFHVVMCEHLKV